MLPGQENEEGSVLLCAPDLLLGIPKLLSLLTAPCLQTTEDFSSDELRVTKICGTIDFTQAAMLFSSKASPEVPNL